MNVMRIHKISRVGEKRFEYSYSVEGEWSIYFEESNPMWVEYSENVSHVPDSIAVLPLIGNVIVLASLMNAEIYVDEIDKDFYECVEEFIQGFDNLMPENVVFKHLGIIRARKIVENILNHKERKENLLFFSGGVDATLSLVNHLEERPALVTVWGADIPWNSENTWLQAIEFNRKVAEKYHLSMIEIRSNFRKSLHDDNVNTYSMNLVKDWWWSAFHHSIAMMCLAAPVSNGKREKLYFGSSYSSKDKKEWGKYVLASDPQIDDHVRFCGCQVIHDGYEFSRYDKIQRICEFYRNETEKPYLRVCYLSNTGKNCGVCEKCASAIMSILLVGDDPRQYGFKYDENLPKYFVAGMQEMAREGKYDFLSLYKDVQVAYRSKIDKVENVPPVLKAFYDTELEVLADFLYVSNNECIEMERAMKRNETQLYDEIGTLQYRLQVSETEKGVLEEKIIGLEKEIDYIRNSLSWKIEREVKRAICRMRKGKNRE